MTPRSRKVIRSITFASLLATAALCAASRTLALEHLACAPAAPPGIERTPVVPSEQPPAERTGAELPGPLAQSVACVPAWFTFTYYLPVAANETVAVALRRVLRRIPPGGTPAADAADLVSAQGTVLLTARKTLLQGRNQADTSALIYMKAHPRGVPAGDLDPVSQPVSVGPGVSFDYQNLLADIFQMQGAAWVEIQSDQPLSFEVSNTYNQAPDGSRQGTGYPVFDAATIATNPKIMHRGDMAEYRLLGEENGKRENWILFNPPGSQELIARLKLLDSNGMVKAENWYVVPANTYWPVFHGRSITEEAAEHGSS